ncbi:hypothetical protein GOARA_027_00290 [Gordonia araii NBRC 100433]|uniref:DoxX family protein n=1 Tax=Gordonia araii NBRC 100433 TaxID=1073574 RepID=G7GZP1_9ACTN|nr:DoxX family protein [Gordonia araii]NNG98871.1 DoxX family protein [Gordonia araii NBRC 100433]GAB09066.1 hypothetical protein GOARA_027_00290 [Gordonia araii NBRC 100433]
MSVAAIALSLVLVVICLFAGLPKVVLRGMPTANLRRHGFGDGKIRFIGAAETAAAVGLLVGLRYHPIGIASAVGMTILLLGAVGYHVAWGDYTGDSADRANAMPAVVSAVVAIATVVTIVASQA